MGHKFIMFSIIMARGHIITVARVRRTAVESSPTLNRRRRNPVRVTGLMQGWVILFTWQWKPGTSLDLLK